MRSMLTEIYLCHACSCHEISRMETPGQVKGPTAARSPPEAFDWAAAASPSAGSGGAYDLFQYVYKSANQKDDFTPFRNNFTGDWATVSDMADFVLPPRRVLVYANTPRQLLLSCSSPAPGSPSNLAAATTKRIWTMSHVLPRWAVQNHKTGCRATSLFGPSTRLHQL